MQQGDHIDTIRQQSREAAWTIATPDDSDKLTDQPTPISLSTRKVLQQIVN